jgi:hypothetical protein
MRGESAHPAETPSVSFGRFEKLKKPGHFAASTSQHSPQRLGSR